MDGAKNVRAKPLYESDFYTWTQEQAELLRRGRLEALDLANIHRGDRDLGTLEIGEPSLELQAHRDASSEADRAAHHGDHEMDTYDQARTWQRRGSRGGQSRPQTETPETFVKGYASARRDAAAETTLSVDLFPVEAPFTVEEAEDPAYWPSA